MEVTESIFRGTVHAKQRFEERDDAILFEFFIIAAASCCGRMQHSILLHSRIRMFSSFC
jgi:hypothetical protein